ncbi:group III truncated hemoglobin [Deinococcus humi]|uniref:Hemoglobin n=1 Tax=Deinococcus humi TaxID=662880 RepID=A0A7W8NES5_9DEIO|nr:group III truncated hemoglobin [Deinococcus humi]MBB5363631.1 hemoglobin [Deinococcus humi]GGO29976.1 hypothetical protein GCM10008949_24210 [Deinococcus humi]
MTLYDRVGDERLRVLLYAFYRRAAQHPELGPVFTRVLGPFPRAGWPVHLLRIEGFWRTVMGGAGAYRGAPGPAHQSLGIDASHFEAWLHLWREALNETLPSPDAEAVYQLAARMRVNLQRVATTPVPRAGEN